MTGRNMDLKYGPDGEAIEHAVIAGDAVLQLAGQKGAPGRQITANVLDITLAPGSRIAGYVRTAAGAPVQSTIFLIPAVRRPDRPDLLRLMNTDAAGRFEIFGVAPGEYRVSSANDNEPGRESLSLTVAGDLLGVNLLLSADGGLRRVP